MGMGRFDGVRMIPFTQENLPLLGSNVVQAFYAAEDGTFWVGTIRGLVWLKNGVWSQPPALAPIAGVSIRMICSDGRGGVLIGLKDDIYRYANGRCEKVVLDNGIAVKSLNWVLTRRSGEVILCGRPTVVLNQGHARILSSADGLSNDESTTAAEDKWGGLWIGTSRGLHYWKDGMMKSFSVKDGLPVNTIRSLLVDQDQNVWVGTPNGLTRFNGGHFEQVIVNGVERLSHVLCLFEDREGNVWGGTDAGFFRLTDAPFVNISQRDGLQSNSVVSVFQSRDGSAWIGTWGGGLSHLTTDTLRTYRTSDGMLEDGVLSLAEDLRGRLWVGYYGKGVACLESGRFINYGVAEGVSERVYQIGVGPTGEIWIIQIDAGLCRLVGDHFEKVPGCPVTDLRTLHVESSGAVDVAGVQGVGRYAEGKWTLYPRAKEATSSDPPQAMAADARGAIWIIRDGGQIDRFFEGRVDTVKLPATVGPLGYGATVLNDELWASFRFGAIRVKISELDDVIAGKKSDPAFSIFGETDGMRSRAPNLAGAPGVTAMLDGTVWFATSKGVAVVHPDRIRKHTQSPAVAIESIRADKRELPVSNLRIPPGRGELEFQFSAMTLTDPARVVFRYRLVGFDRDWSPPGKTREAHYGGLAPGTYRFEVAARSDNAPWNPNPASITVTILPFFYQKAWFWALVIASVIAIGVAGYLWRVRRIEKKALALQRQNEELERGIAERTAELAKSNEALRASEYFYTSLVESMPQVILRKGLDGRITYANSSFGELMRRPLGEIIGKIDYDLCIPEVAAKLRSEDQRVISTGEVMEQEHIIDRPGEPRRYLHCKRLPLYDKEGRPMGIQVLFWDMTRFRETEDKLKAAQREVVEMSRLAGIAEMATGVLHNIGNALNSVNTSASVVADAIRGMKLSGINRVAEMLRGQKEKLVEFLTADPRGKQLPDYIGKVAEHLEMERQLALRELVQLERSVGHIKEIVVAQQSHARVSGITETVSPAELLEYAIGISELSLRRRNVTVTREFLPTPLLHVPKQKVLQILVNLIRNASDSLEESNRPDKRLWLGLGVSADGKVQLRVIDNGVGISQENLTRIFAFGFTTKKTGHGFGLHSSALAAREMEGSLIATSPGLGKGATFILELPAAPSVTAPETQKPSASLAKA